MHIQFSKEFHEKIKEYLMLAAGAFLLSCGMSLFCVPNKIVGGGVSGISTVLYHKLNIPIGLSYSVINIFLLIAGVNCLSGKFTFRTFVCSGITSFFTQVLSSLNPFTRDILLAAVIGGGLYGAGICLTLISDASTGGTDIVARIIQTKKPHFKIGKALMLIDCIVIFISFLCFKEADLTLYGFLSLFISSTVIDIMIHKFNASGLVFVVTEHGEKISSRLVATSKRGITCMEAVGAYTGKNKKVLICVIKEKEVVEFKRKILDMDKNAFVIFSVAREIMGNGFYIYH